MNMQERIDSLSPRRSETGQPLGWSPAYLDGFHTARHAAAEIASDGDALIAEMDDVLTKALGLIAILTPTSGGAKEAAMQTMHQITDVLEKARAFGVRS